MKYVAWYLLDSLIIALTYGFTILIGPWAWWPAMLIIGSRQLAYGEIGHMATHRSIGLGKFGSKVMAWVTLGPLGIDPDRFRDFHMAHHRYVGHPQLDPEVEIQHLFQERWRTPPDRSTP